MFWSDLSLVSPAVWRESAWPWGREWNISPEWVLWRSARICAGSGDKPVTTSRITISQQTRVSSEHCGIPVRQNSEKVKSIILRKTWGRIRRGLASFEISLKAEECFEKVLEGPLKPTNELSDVPGLSSSCHLFSVCELISDCRGCQTGPASCEAQCALPADRGGHWYCDHHSRDITVTPTYATSLGNRRFSTYIFIGKRQSK